MGVSVFYLPRTKLSSPELWETVRNWQKTAAGGWDRVRLTPDFYAEQSLNRTEMAAMLDMVRLKQVDRVLYAELEEGQCENLDWLAFVYSLKGYGVPVESLDGQLLDLDRKLEKLTLSFQQLQGKSKSQPQRAKQEL